MSALVIFKLGSPNPAESVDDVSALTVYAHEWGRYFHKVETSNILSCPMVYDTGQVQVSHISNMIVWMTMNQLILVLRE